MGAWLLRFDVWASSSGPQAQLSGSQQGSSRELRVALLLYKVHLPVRDMWWCQAIESYRLVLTTPGSKHVIVLRLHELCGGILCRQSGLFTHQEAEAIDTPVANLRGAAPQRRACLSND